MKRDCVTVWIWEGELPASQRLAGSYGKVQPCPSSSPSALSCSHSSSETMRKPLPLQAFLPAQLLPALLQADWLLQALTPSHFTFASALSSAAKAGPAM